MEDVSEAFYTDTKEMDGDQRQESSKANHVLAAGPREFLQLVHLLLVHDDGQLATVAPAHQDLDVSVRVLLGVNDAAVTVSVVVLLYETVNCVAGGVLVVSHESVQRRQGLGRRVYTVG